MHCYEAASPRQSTTHTVGITIDNANALQKTTSDSGSQAADQT